MPMPDHRRLHSTSQLTNGRVKAKPAFYVAGDVAEATRKRRASVAPAVDVAVSERARQAKGALHIAGGVAEHPDALHSTSQLANGPVKAKGTRRPLRRWGTDQVTTTPRGC